MTGFSAGIPAYVRPASIAIDQELAAEMRAPCGRVGMVMQTLRKGMRYRSIASCPCGCGYREEF
jgi:hypothetical protein